VPDVKPLSPAPTSTGTTAPPTKDAGTTPVTTSDAGSSAGGAFIGTLSATPATQFGGVSPHCTYDVTLKNVSIEIDLNPNGQVIGGTVSDLMVETIVGSCPYAPQANSQQAFAFSTANGTTLSWIGGTDNHPQTDLKIELTKAGASYQAAATWTRTDLTDDFQWVVKTEITLGQR
jgi:hypothetical protein